MNDVADFHAVRLTGLGSSDAAPACGVSQWRSPMDVYREKRGEAQPQEDTEPLRFGRLLEPVVLAEFSRRTGLAIEANPPVVRSAEYPFMLAHLDGITERDGQRLVVEAKTARSGDGFGAPGTADIPVDYVVQTHHQMIVTGCRLAFVPVLIAGSDFRTYEVPFDRELGDMIVGRERDLWERIQRADPPPIDPDAPGALELIRRVYRGTNGQRIRASEADEHWRAVHKSASDWRDSYTIAADTAKAHLLLTMGEAAELAFADGTLLRRREITRKGYVVEPTTFIDARFTKAKE